MHSLHKKITASCNGHNVLIYTLHNNICSTSTGSRLSTPLLQEDHIVPPPPTNQKPPGNWKPWATLYSYLLRKHSHAEYLPPPPHKITLPSLVMRVGASSQKWGRAREWIASTLASSPSFFQRCTRKATYLCMSGSPCVNVVIALYWKEKPVVIQIALEKARD